MNQAAQRYIAWVGRWRIAILAAGAAILAASLYLAANHLPVRADFAHLLPDDAPAVRDLRRLQERITAQDALLVVVDAPDRERRARAAAAMGAALRELPPDLVTRVEDDDSTTRNFLRSHRHLFVPLADLSAARDALRDRIRQAKRDANPLFVDLEEEESEAAAAAAGKRLDELRARRAEAEAALARSAFVSEDGRYQLLVVRTTFENSDIERGERLLAALEQARTRILAGSDLDGVDIGFTAGVASTVAEHHALVRGMLRSSLVTALLVAAVLLLFFRSARLLLLLAFTLVVGTAAAFGVAALTVGQLNAATAFLAAIIAGNGVNYGILILVRYLEERRTHGPEDAMAAAVHGTLRPTLVASLGASIAYASLAATSFRGFADFALIGGIGMLLCWLVSYALLPVLVLGWARPVGGATSEPFLGGWIVRIFGFRRAGLVCAATAVVAAAAGAVSWRFISQDPYEYDMKELRSAGAEALEVRRWLDISDRSFGRRIAGQTIIAADRPEQVPEIVAALRQIDAGASADRRIIGKVSSILDVVPDQQAAKLAVLADIRTLLDDDALEALTDAERAELTELRPPDDLAPITADRLPEALASKLREKDGRVGLLVAVRPDLSLDEWNGRDLIRFAGAVRKVELASGETVTTSGTQVVYADIIASMRADAPQVVVVAVGCLILMLLLVVGVNVRALAVMAATGLGSLALIAICAVADLEVTFLDFMALPITLGLGVDYAINMAHRHDHSTDGDAMAVLRTNGAAVFICSLTTIIGYGSLLLSDNRAISGFGTASLIGEVCCLVTALVVVPAIITVRRSRRVVIRSSSESTSPTHPAGDSPGR